VDDVLLASLKTKFAGKTKVLNWLDEVTDNAILAKLDDLPTSSITKMEDDILALKSHFNSNPNSITSWNRLVGAPNSIRKNVDLLDNVASWPTSWNLNTVGNSAEVIQSSGRKIATITDGRIIAPARTLTGTAGNPLLNRVPLVKNVIYEVDGIEYITDNLGRVTKTTADLDDVVRVRLGNQQIRAVDIKDGVNGIDQGGHIVASRFFGPGEQINLYPQSANLNQGAWKQMENSWATDMVAGKDVKIEVEAIFSGSSQRPTSFQVKYTIDGQPFQENFINQ